MDFFVVLVVMVGHQLNGVIGVCLKVSEQFFLHNLLTFHILEHMR